MIITASSPSTRKSRFNRLLGVTPHETLHLMQKARGLSEIDPAGDIYSLQSRFPRE